MAGDRQAEVLRRVLESWSLDLHVALPGKVRSYDPDAQTVEVEIQVRRVIPSGDETEADTVEDYPILPSVPVLYPRATGSGGGFVWIRPRAGDRVLVVFSEADLGQWRATGETSDPGLATRHGLSGGVAIPGLHWQGGTNADVANTEADLVLGLEGGAQVEVYPAQINVGGSQSLAKASETDNQLAAIMNDLAAHRVAINALGGALPADSIQAVRPANPIATSTTRGS